MPRAFVTATILLVASQGEALSGPAEDAARDATRRGTAAYNLGQFDEAAREYETAYKAAQEPLLLFNIGQAYRQADKPEKALNAYRAYLRTARADAPNRAAVEQRVGDLEVIVTQQRASQAAHPPGTPFADPRLTEPPAATRGTAPSVSRRWWFWAGAGALALGALAAAVALSADKEGKPLCPGDLKGCL